MNLRPTILSPLFSDISRLPGVGPKISNLLEKLAGKRIIDLILHFPNNIVDRRHNPDICNAVPETVCTLRVEVVKHIPNNRYSKSPYRIVCRDKTGDIIVTFFRGQKRYLEQILPVGKIRIISGKVESYDGNKQITHPDHVVCPEEIETIQRVEAIYPLTLTLSPKTLQRAINASLKTVPDFPEWLSNDQIQKNKWLNWKDSINVLHSPEHLSDLDPNSSTRERLAYDELLSNQLALALVRINAHKLKGHALNINGILEERFINFLPYSLTNSQIRSLREIKSDLSSETRMLRLLQGDVGSGKTIVAISTMLSAVESGGQAVIMAPTEILAKQHYETISKICDKLSVSTTYLSGSIKGKSRTQILEKINKGNISIIVGTHALFQKDVIFNNLMVAVIDEQHRFGVHQRLQLANKGTAVDVLVMTATPIPRTLTLTAYGDMDISRLEEKPKGRQPIDTRIVNLNRLDEMIAAIRRAIDQNAKIYWICPLVEESEIMDIAAAEERFKSLESIFGNRVALIHGRMPSDQREKVITSFAKNTSENPVKILVSTTVIEVGIDVPDATIIIIEHAERFGLTQLHQLRGRVGRGDKPSNCILLYKDPLTTTAEQRLNIIKNTEDGFLIAEEDLKIRGSGDILGTKQSGMPQFKIANLHNHSELLATARNESKLILNKDPKLESTRGSALRILLYLFEQNDAILTLRSG